ncbi:MAG: CRISPR-associated protein Csx16, partial [Betaproteobacteria bacterium HGW-Betaproteobacteria-17]
MTTFLVTRHPGAVQWAAAQGIAADVCCPHLDPADVATGDTVIGTLPVHLVAEVCARGRSHAHGLRATQAFHVIFHARFGRVVGQQARQRFGVFVAHVDNARLRGAIALQDGGQFG